MRSRFLVSLAVITFVFTCAFAFAAGAQESTDASATATQDESSEQPLIFAEGEQMTQAQAAQADAKQPGPLAGTTVDTFSTDSDMEIEVITIARPECQAKVGASCVLQDEDGTQATFIDDENVQITEVSKGLKVVSNVAGPGEDIIFLNERGNDNTLDTGGS